MDCVYVLGSGSAWADNELRYSLRSLKNVQGVDKVFIVGNCPHWVTNVIHLPFGDHFSCKEKNIMLKLARACGHPDLSDKFLHLHDDHFCLAPTLIHTIPNWCGGSLQTIGRQRPGEKKNNWRDACMNTYNALSAAGLPTLNYDLHYPMIFDKNLYPGIMDRYNWKEPRGFVVKSLYANTAGLIPTRSPDLKINGEADTMSSLVDRLRGRSWFSIGNKALSPPLKLLFPALYPERSIYEKY